MFKKIKFIIVILTLTVFTSLYCFKPVGLQNCGNSCYFNSIIQSLHTIPQLTTFTSHYLNCYKPGSLTTQYGDLISSITHTQFENEEENAIIQIIPQTNPHLSNLFKNTGIALSGESFVQEDAQQFLQLFLDDLYDTGLNPLPSNSRAKKARDQVRKMFGLKITSSLMLCDGAQNPATKAEEVFMLSVEIPSYIKPVVHLEDCLHTFFAPEVIEKTSEDRILWEKTSTYESIFKQLGLETAPEVLTIHLKRFKWNKELKQSEKIQTPVLLPINFLDVRPYLNNPNPNTIYELKAVVAHNGNAKGGHYLAYVKYPCPNTEDSQWYKCNDPEITPISLTEINKLETLGYIDQSDCPYILFYQRIDTSTFYKKK